MKHISVFSKHFWPENFKINDVTFNLNKNFKINVYTSEPNYNNLKYKKLFKNNNLKRLKIIYFKTFKKNKNNFFQISYDYISYVFNLLLKINFYLNKRADICLTFATSPIFQAIPAIYYARLKKIPSIVWVQDLWPEVLSDTGYIKNKIILKFIDKIVKIIYNKSDIVLAQSKSFENHLKKKYHLKNKVYTLHQPSDYKFQKFNSIKGGKYIITYAGNLGKAQDFDTILDAFKSNKINKNVKLNIIGSGKKFFYLKNKIDEYKINSKVTITSYKNKKDLLKILRFSSAFFLSLNQGESLDKTIPGKFQTYIAFGKPILVCSCGEINNIVVKNSIGLSSRPKNTKKLIFNINKLSKMSEIKKKKIYFSSKKLYEELFDLKKITYNLENYFYKAKKNYVKKSLL
tara:strand:+ start:502 stop:1707 length:1206 start_codon:yes stop_codon:yes gene_type:complete